VIQTPDSIPFFVTGGSLPENAPSYVERKADHEIFSALSHGQFCYVLDSRQVGKSSLMVRTAARLRKAGVCVALLDLSASGQNVTMEQWYYSLAYSIGEQLGMETEMDKFWDEHARLSPVQRWMESIRKVALARNDSSLVIFVDEVDAVRSLGFSVDEFFAAVRELHNRRVRDAGLDRLSFCLLGVATPSRLIRSVETTPFNIGRQIELTDFTYDEALPLIEGLMPSSRDARQLLQRILYWTGGHPYLTQRLCRAVTEAGGASQPETIDQLCDRLFLSRQARETDHNLLFVRNRILEDKDSQSDIASVLTLYKAIRFSRRQTRNDPKDPRIALLRLSGLVIVQDGKLVLRNRIYAHVFGREWLQSSMPGEELRRQRRAMWVGFARASAVWLLFLFAFAFALRQTYAARIIAAENLDLKTERANLQKSILASRQEVKRMDEKRLQAAAQIKAAKASLAKLDERRLKAERQAGIAADHENKALKQSTQARAGLGTALDRSKLANALSKTRKQGREVEALREYCSVLQAKPSLLSSAPEVGTNLITVSTSRAYLLNRLHHSQHVNTASFSPDGQLALTSTLGRQIYLWNPITGRLLRSIAGAPKRHTGEIFSAEFSPDGVHIVSASVDRLCVWDAGSGVLVSERKLDKANYATAIYSPDGRSIGVCSLKGYTAAILDAGTLEPRVSLVGHKGAILSIQFSANSRWVVTASADNTARVWNARTGELINTMTHPDQVLGAAFSPCYNDIVSVDKGGDIRRWEWDTGNLFTYIHGHDNAIRSVAFSPDGREFITASDDRTVKVWNARRIHRPGIPLETFAAHPSYVYDARFSPDGRHIITASYDNQAHVWALPDNSIAGPTDVINSVEFSPDGSLLVGSCSDSTAWVWNASTGKRLAQLEGIPVAVVHATFSPNGRTIAGAGRNGSVAVWQVNPMPDGQVKLKDHLDFKDGKLTITNCVHFSPEGSRLMAAGEGPAVCIWDVRTQKLVLTLKGHTKPVQCCSYSRDGHSIVTGGMDNTVRTWDAHTGRQLLLINAHAQRVWDAEFSPDGKYIVSSGADSTVQVWDARTGSHIASYPDKVGNDTFGDAMAACFSPDGRWLLTASLDGVARIWRVGDPSHPVYEVEAHRMGITWAAFSPDGSRFATSSQDATVRVFPVSPKDYLTKATGVEKAIYRFRRENIPPPTDVSWNSPVVGEGSKWGAGLYEKCFNQFGGEKKVGKPVTRCHGWGNLEIQEVQGGEAGDGALIYSPKEKNVIWIQGTIWNTYRDSRGPDGPLGSPKLGLGAHQALSFCGISANGAIGFFSSFEHGNIYYTNKTGAHALWGSFLDCYLKSGGTEGPLGFPTSPRMRATTSLYGSTGEVQRFEKGSIYWSKTYGAVPVCEPIAREYEKPPVPGTSSRFGFPRGTAYIVDGTVRQDFEGGTMSLPTNLLLAQPTIDVSLIGEGSNFQGLYQECYRKCGGERVVGFSDNKAHPWEGIEIQEMIPAGDGRKGALVYCVKSNRVIWMTGAIWDRYVLLGEWRKVLGDPLPGPNGEPYETPIQASPSGAKGYYQRFERGTIYASSEGAFPVFMHMDSVYQASGGPLGPLGFPVAVLDQGAFSHFGTTGDVQRFQKGIIHWSPRYGAFAIYGPIFDEFAGLLGTGGDCGFPTSPPYLWKGNLRQDFEGASLTDKPKIEIPVGENSTHGDAFAHCMQAVRTELPIVGTMSACRPFGAGEIQIVRSSESGPTGLIYNPATKRVACVTGGMFFHYMKMGGAESTLGLPLSGLNGEPMENPTGRARSGNAGSALVFDHGALYWSNKTGVVALQEEEWQMFRQMGGVGGPLGFPMSSSQPVRIGPKGQKQLVQQFDDGVICRSDGGIFAIYGPVYDRWKFRGGAVGPLGFPTGPIKKENGRLTQAFENGTISECEESTSAVR
jgi:WD40 repeat protein/uncharacterized protein with LGFP repeats